MQVVSNEWKSNQKETLVSESFVEVSLDIADPDAIADASSADNGAIYISNTPQVVREVDKKVESYLTLEQNVWILDGRRKSIPQTNYGDNGFVGDILSDERGSFKQKAPTLSIHFTRTHGNVIPAVTITWGKVYNEFAEDFKVVVYNGDKEIAEKEVIGNQSVKSVVEMDIVNYDRIEIIVLRWCLPYHRARIEDVFVGMNKVYDKHTLFGFSHSQVADPISTSLPKSEISFSIDNVDDTYNPFNALGMSKYLMERQEVKTRYGYKYDNGAEEWINGGTFYLCEWDAVQGGLTAEFVARDLLEFMSSNYHKGQYYPQGIDLYTLAENVFTSANLPLNGDGSAKWLINDRLKDIYTIAPLPIDTLANCLQLIANAAGCVLYQDRKGVLHIEPPNTSYFGMGVLGDCILVHNESDYRITYDNSYSKSTMALSKPVKQVDVAMYYYFSEDEVELYKGAMSVNGTEEVILTYSSSAIDAEAVVTNGTLVDAEYYTNACKLTVTAEGDVEIVINGRKLTSANSYVTIAGDGNGETVVIDNPLITNSERATAVGTWIESYLKSRMTLTSSWRADPRLDVLDIIRNVNEYETNLVRMTDVTLTYNGAFRGSGEGRVV